MEIFKGDRCIGFTRSISNCMASEIGYGPRFTGIMLSDGGIFDANSREGLRMWFEIEVGKPFRLRNQYGQELDRTIVSMDEKTVTYQRHEVEPGKLSTIGKNRFLEIYNLMGIPYMEGQYGDIISAFIDPDIEFDEEEGQLTLF